MKRVVNFYLPSSIRKIIRKSVQLPNNYSICRTLLQEDAVSNFMKVLVEVSVHRMHLILTTQSIDLSNLHMKINQLTLISYEKTMLLGNNKCFEIRQYFISQNSTSVRERDFCLTNLKSTIGYYSIFTLKSIEVYKSWLFVKPESFGFDSNGTILFISQFFFTHPYVIQFYVIETNKLPSCWNPSCLYDKITFRTNIDNLNVFVSKAFVSSQLSSRSLPLPLIPSRLRSCCASESEYDMICVCLTDIQYAYKSVVWKVDYVYFYSLLWVISSGCTQELIFLRTSKSSRLVLKVISYEPLFIITIKMWKNNQNSYFYNACIYYFIVVAHNILNFIESSKPFRVHLSDFTRK